MSCPQSQQRLSASATFSRPATPAFDAFSEELFETPHLIYKTLRDEAPVYWSAQLRAWVVTSFEDARTVLTDNNFQAINTSEILSEIGRRTSRDYGSLINFLAASLFFRNGADHRRDRRTLAKVFNRVPLRRLDSLAAEIAETLIAPLRELATYDAIGAFADPFPQTVMALIIGIPSQDVSVLSRLLSDLTLVFEPASLETYDRINGNVTCALELLQERIQEARRCPGSGLDVIYEAAPGDGPEKLRNAAATALFAFRVGAETTIGLLGSLIRALATEPNLGPNLCAHPERTGALVDEVLRLESNVQRSGRIAQKTCTIGSERIEAGDRLLLLLGAANRDPLVFDNPDDQALDQERPADLVFGGGDHICMGASLARMEGRIALHAFSAMPPFELAGEVSWFKGRTIRRMTALPLRLRQNASDQNTPDQNTPDQVLSGRG